MWSRLRRMFAPCPLPRRDDPRIHVGPDGFAVDFIEKYWPPWRRRLGTAAVRWAEVERVVAYKWDCFTVDLICLEFELTGGQHVNIHEEEKGWHAVVEALPEKLPGALSYEAWFGTVAFPAFATNPTVIYGPPLPPGGTKAK